jgi:type IV pilus assembly protein PilY1
MVNCLSKSRQFFGAVLFSLAVFNPVWAEDIEIFFSQQSDRDLQPNVLFILDGSGSMGDYDGTSETRLERLRSSLTSVLENTSNINAGLMRFSHYLSGGAVTYPIRPIDQQICNGQPCDDDTTFSTQSQVASSSDDATEAGNGAVTLTEQRLTLMQYPGLPVGAKWVGLRFPDMQIPQGATITDARLDFSSTGEYDDYTNLTFFAEDTHDAAPFEANFNHLSNRTRTSNSVAWNDVPKWLDDSTFESPDLTPVLQRIVDKDNWCGGNAIAMLINGSGGRLASAFDNGSADGPVLRVEYKLQDIPDTGGCSTTTIISRVTDDVDDAMERSHKNNSRNGLIYRTTNNLIIRSRPPYNNGYKSGMILRDIAVPRNAVIVDANLVATVSSRYSAGDVTVNISLENSGNPDNISSNKFDLSDRNYASSSVAWNNIPTVENSTVESPSLKDLTQSIVNRSDWADGNDMTVLLEASGNGQRSFWSHDASPSSAPALKIRYETRIRTASDKITGPVSDVRSEIIQVLNDMLPEGGTPTVGAMLEAKRYFEGDDVEYGKFRYPFSQYHGAPHYWGKYGRISHEDSYTGGNPVRSHLCLTNALNGINCPSEQIAGPAKYISPIESECQSNHIVLLTDGYPTVDAPTRSAVTGLTGSSCDPQQFDQGTCGEELAEFLKDSDTPITTHTIGFNFTTQWLRDVAQAGGGGFYTADTADQLSEALNRIISGVQDVNTTFVAPGVTVDRFSRLTHRNDLYLALFQPKSTPRWVGNMKRYELNGQPVSLYDANDNLAIDPATGQFFESAQSYWSDSADGNNVSAGGAAHELDHNVRKVYTDINGDDLTAVGNVFDISNSDLTYAHLGLDPTQSSKRDLLIEWARGVDVDDEDGDDDYNDTRPHIGDPLHSQPQIVTYDGPSTDPVSVIFMATNQGFLHAIDRDDGKEVFSFIPEQLLPNLQILYDNNPAYRKPYGLDGPMTIWTQDNNSNGIIESDDHVYLYVGMRRGGNDYYALDVSDMNNPKMLFQVKGGTGEFSEMGQSWSAPVVAKIKYLGASRQVLIVAGGYDTDQDNYSYRTDDNVGRIIYMIDAQTGEKLWSGGHAEAQPSKVFSDMQYSMPSGVRTIDGDGDGHVEQFYIGDMGGQVWRFDIDPDAGTEGSLVSGGVIAELASGDTTQSNRRFYHAPDISFSLKEGKYVLNIGVGSGYQAHPLNKTIEDRYYLIRYPYELNAHGEYGITADADDPNAVYSAITEGELFDATDNVLGEGSSDDRSAANAELSDSSGWMLRMERGGEKILGSSLTLNNVVMFTSYVPAALSHNCQPQLGTGIFWAVDLWDATPAANLDGEGDEGNLTKEDRNKYVPGSGLPAAVQTYFVETTSTDDDGNVTSQLAIATSSGPHVLLEHDPGNLTERIYWSEYPDF